MDPEQYSDPEDIYYDDEYEDEDQYEADLSTMCDMSSTFHIRTQKSQANTICKSGPLFYTSVSQSCMK